eukprot:248860_1
MDFDVSSFWIGLSRTGTVWGWDDGSACIVNHELCWSHWNSGEPSNTGGTEDRAELGLTTNWIDVFKDIVVVGGANDATQTGSKPYACNAVSRTTIVWRDLYVFQSNSDYVYTTNKYESQSGNIGVMGQLATPYQHVKGVPLYRYYISATMDHFLTTNCFERGKLLEGGYIEEGIIGDCFANPTDVDGVTLVELTRWLGTNGDHCYSTPGSGLCADKTIYTVNEGPQCYVKSISVSAKAVKYKWLFDNNGNKNMPFLEMLGLNVLVAVLCTSAVITLLYVSYGLYSKCNKKKLNHVRIAMESESEQS